MNLWKYSRGLIYVPRSYRIHVVIYSSATLKMKPLCSLVSWRKADADCHTAMWTLGLPGSG